MLCSFIDITDRVKAELEVHRLHLERKTIEHKERQRIAQMLHDDLQQRLFAIKMYLNTLDEPLQNDNPPSTGMDHAKPVEWLDEAITLTRQLSVDLSPLNFREANLAEAILSLSSLMKDRYGLDVELVEKDFELKFDDELQITLFQSIRELLFNIVKHSGSLKATATLEQVDPDWVTITVSDEGKGFDARAIFSGKKPGRGLRSIQQELKLFGCRLEVDSGEQTGTRMIIHVPTGESVSRP